MGLGKIKARTTWFNKVEFKLTPKDNGTNLLLTHYDLPVEEIPSHQQGWSHYMPRIKQFAEGKDPGVDPWSELAMH
jgi:hypothetical protein